MMSLVRAQLGEPQTRYKLIGVDDAEGPPVPIPNTEVKLCGAENSALATRCENREMPILVASFLLSDEADFYSRLFYYTTEERQEDTISKVNEEYMNLISGTLFDCYVVKLCNRTHKKRVSCVLKFFEKRLDERGKMCA